MGISIGDIAYCLPDVTVDNDVLRQENPSWDVDVMMRRVGVRKRHIAGKDETALDLATRACQKLFDQQSQLKDGVDGVIFCTQSEDHIMPSNAHILHKHLGLSEKTFAFDINQGCSGFLYGLFLGKGLMGPGGAQNILLINADTYSKFIHPQDRSARMLFGDGAAVTWLTQAEGEIVDLVVATAGAHYDAFIIPAGGCRLPKNAKTGVAEKDRSGSVRTQESIHMDGAKILSFVNTKVPVQVREILERNAMTIDQIDLFIFHQASRVVLDYLKNALKIPDHKFYENFTDIGNLVSASIPVALKDAMNEGRVRRGNKILVSGFGVGLSWATAIIKL